ncbi:MAG: ABC transporter ATP-binding protein [Synergistaceae bacterium]|jgi:iron(III) transport system ATP-binding protein|nr:ABC transporter ATP-binding protein [Synergistaceae bacterium]
MSTEISVENIKKSFGTFDALKSVSAHCPPGTFTAILGPSGCGKTTLLRLVAGFDVPTAGQILFDGKPVSSPLKITPPERRGIGMVFQSFALWPHMTVLDHVVFALKHSHKRKMETSTDKEAAKILESVGLWAFRSRYPAQLSGGQRQRVALARAVAGNTGVLLMDEPLSSLDADLRVEMRQEIMSQHRAHGNTVVYVTHDQEEAMAMADRIIVMNEGHVEQTGTPEEIYTRPASAFVARFVSKANLVPGVWEGDAFRPEGSSGDTRWSGDAAASFWRASGMFPVRPEQFRFSGERRGIPAIVESVQYQGRELHYSLVSGGRFWKAYLPAGGRRDIGSEVWLDLEDV